MARAIVDNINYVAQFTALLEEGEVSFVGRMTFWGTEIVAPVDMVHPLRWGFASPANLLPVPGCIATKCTVPVRNVEAKKEEKNGATPYRYDADDDAEPVCEMIV
jgi:hypothetical protein